MCALTGFVVSSVAYVRTVKTAWGAIAVRIVYSSRRAAAACGVVSQAPRRPSVGEEINPRRSGTVRWLCIGMASVRAAMFMYRERGSPEHCCRAPRLRASRARSLLPQGPWPTARWRLGVPIHPLNASRREVEAFSSSLPPHVQVRSSGAGSYGQTQTNSAARSGCLQSPSCFTRLAGQRWSAASA